MPLCCLRIQRSFFIYSDNETTDQEDVERVKIGPKGKQSSTNNGWTSAVQENFKSVDPASARFRVIGSLNPKYLKWGSKKPRSAKSEMRIRRRYVEMDSGASRKPSNPIADYCDSLEQETGRRKDAVAPKVLNSRKEKAISYLENKGWKTTIGLKKDGCKLKLYFSPNGVRFASLRTACLNWIEQQRSSDIGQSMKNARTKRYFEFEQRW